MNAITDKLYRSWQLFRRSVLVIQQNPMLLIFPVVTGLLTAGIALFFLAPVGLMIFVPHWVAGTKVHWLADSFGFLRFHPGPSSSIYIQPVGTAILAGVYLVNMFLATMSSVAFNHEILEALSGRPVSIVRGLEAACSRWKSILLWSLLAGVVGLLIRAVEQRLAFVGRLVAGLIGLAWSVAAIFAIPILARETVFSNPFTILTKSAETIKRTWGEMLTGYAGMKGTNLLVLPARAVGFGYFLAGGGFRDLRDVQRVAVVGCRCALAASHLRLRIPGEHCQPRVCLCTLPLCC